MADNPEDTATPENTAPPEDTALPAHPQTGFPPPVVPPRSRTRKWVTRGIVTVVVLAPLVYIGLVVRSVVTGEIFEPHGTGCGKAVSFAGGRMPEGATDRKCVDDGGWLNQGYTVEFRMPREDVAARLREAFPRTRQVSGFSSADLEFTNSQETDRPAGEASHVELEVTYEDEDTASVRLRAFDV
ncbi:hypothetical protein AF335_12140 [Streptomyces eurocidicus]|uniref:Uncharacterized protein n=1 Tax=Streptomyces eurocidicus TaxID=66423 RepID=A0A2N8NXU2_STREU|nr:hypothetical protein [Streptomyces eurocidicus]MBB5123042.1 hypothetical protein [Streptomyces eurocidicus]MBF6053835.1 hypothetical protein [Streptomyces eurocidicus]PNE33589.1 hypothetical protein AF335_12140 [Streptomyces eurocidicus]